MKQLLPLLFIALMIGGVVWFMQDEYEPPFEPAYYDEVNEEGWQMRFFLDPEDDEVHIGIQLNYEGDTFEPDQLEKLEFFVNHETGSFYYQDLDVEGFAGELIHKEVCDACLDESGRLVGSMMINWQMNGEAESVFHQFVLTDIPAEEYPDDVRE
ncbi:hypothetical protein BBEV_2288 [Salisediminibacterium beveridgei]|uniref:Uncharacterized protein n=1 Tax=Salisediminibacterium beveridgei TaxID=632773 RepID=A0A1D7QXA7_9BACI|nr:hypothetical protein BBEV_2288 [Salisediminibacterium beveridgei]